MNITPQVRLQRARNCLIGYLELAANIEQQKQLTDADIVNEVLEQWADWVSPNWRDEFISPVFSIFECAAVNTFQTAWERIHTTLPTPRPSLVQAEHDATWIEFIQAAQVCLKVFLERGRFSETQEI
jgi:hypothetical protein